MEMKLHTLNEREWSVSRFDRFSLGTNGKEAVWAPLTVWT